MNRPASSTFSTTDSMGAVASLDDLIRLLGSMSRGGWGYDG